MELKSKGKLVNAPKIHEDPSSRTGERLVPVHVIDEPTVTRPSQSMLPLTRAFLVTLNSGGSFIGIVVYDHNRESGLHAAQSMWGKSSQYKELSDDELRSYPAKQQLSVYVCNAITY